MERFISTMILDFCVALGLVLGGSLVGAVGALFTHNPPMTYMMRLADQLRIWALVAAVGGTMDPIKVIGDTMWSGIFGGHFSPAVKQFLLLVSAFLGCQVGYHMIKWVAEGKGV